MRGSAERQGRTPPIGELDRSDLADDIAQILHVVVDPPGEHVSVAGGAPCIERRQQHAALQHKPLRKARVRQAHEEALVHVQLERLLPVVRPSARARRCKAL